MQGAGLDLRPMQSIYQYPTLIIFAEGKGIATARALIQASDDSGGLNLRFRQDIRLYYRVSNFTGFIIFSLRLHISVCNFYL